MSTSRAVLTLLLAMAPSARAGSFLSARNDSNAEGFRTALGEIMGCGDGLSQDRISSIRAQLSPIWRSLPKNAGGRVEWRMLRYMAHRHFMQTSSLLVRGLDLMRQVNESSAGNAAVLDKHAPTFAEMLFDGKTSALGFSLDDAATFVATLERVIFDEETHMLELAYADVGHNPRDLVDQATMLHVVRKYVGRWGAAGMSQEEMFVEFAEGTARNMAYKRAQSPQLGHGRAALGQEYSFDDIHGVVGEVTRTFAFYWEDRCRVIKEATLAFDRDGDGRIPLRDFYRGYMSGTWQFAESEAYLQSFGALDTSSKWRGKQVIIPNYLQGPSNCVVTTDHYQVCCLPECEGVLNELEDAIGAPMAPPEKILELVRGMEDFDDRAPKMGRDMVTQLQRIASTNGGQVPLHGRLFAQWLHYTFPHECPYPYKSGERTSLSLRDFGFHRAIATHAERQAGVEEGASIDAVERTKDAAKQSDDDDAQWSQEEELYSQEVGKKGMSLGKRFLLGCAGLAALGAMLSGGLATTDGKGAAVGGRSRGVFAEKKDHYV